MYDVFHNTVTTNEYVWSSGNDIQYDTPPPGFEHEIASPSHPRDRARSRSTSSKRKTPDSTELIEALDRFGTQPRQYLKTSQNIDQDSNLIKGAFDILNNMSMINDEHPLYYVATRAFERHTKRAIFECLGNNDARIRWLKQEQRLQERDNY